MTMNEENKNKLPQKRNDDRPALWEDIRHFARKKYYWAGLLIIIGLFGFVVPVIPGLLLIVFAVALLKPGLMVKLRRKVKKWFGGKM